MNADEGLDVIELDEEWDGRWFTFALVLVGSAVWLIVGVLIGLMIS